MIIDDLDLNIDNGFDMLEKIHRYMMVNNVIVLLAMDYDQMKLLCEKSFYRMIPLVDHKLKERGGDIEKLAQDFLDKVLPSNDRIYLPFFNKMSNVKLQLPASGDGGTYREIKLKDILFRKLYEKLGIRMDVKGKKRHFFEQESMRAFVSFYLMLQSMDDLPEVDNSESFLNTFEQNYKVLMSDTVTRMVDDRLGDTSKKFLTELRYPACPMLPGICIRR